ncbi:MAG TPA: FtsX-like permease family protein [Pseudonocardiaceae bacterium]|jgi:putative ABC transport system permease protein|nr:FtsX-like permease family protein [Pseudonocardiaceae bacterium]
MVSLALRTLRFRTGGFVAAFIALLFGAMIVMACGGMMETGIRTAIAPQRLAGAPIVVTGDQSSSANGSGADYPERVRLDAGLLNKVEAMPGVANAVADVSFPATVLANGKPAGAPSTGHGWDSAGLAPYTLVAGTAPSTARQVVLDSTLAATDHLGVGSPVTLVVDGGSRDFQVVGLVTARTADAATVFFAQDEARSLLGQPGKIDSIGVLPTSGTDLDALTQRLDTVLAGQHVVVLTGDDRGQAEFAGALTGGDNLVVLAGVFGGLAIAVAIFVVGITLSLSIQQRQREMALLRAVGGTPNQLRRMILVEITVVSVFSTALAIVPGQLLGRWLVRSMGATGMLSPEIEFHQGWIPTVSAIGIGVVTALLAGFLAANRAARARPTEALAEAATPRRWLNAFRLIGALLCLGGGTALAIVTMTVMAGPVSASTAGPSAILWACGLALLGPGLCRVCTAVLGWPLRAFTGLAGHLAVLNARAGKIRLAGAMVPIMLATGMAVAMIYLQTTSAADANAEYSASLRADVALSSTTGGLPPGFVDTVRTVPGVAAASDFVTSTGFLTEPGSHDSDDPDVEDYPVQGVDAAAASQTTATNIVAGSLGALTGASIALPTDLAADQGVRVGQTVSIQLGDGTTVTPRLVALFVAPRGYDTILLPADLLAAHTTSGLIPQILVRAASGVTTAQLEADLAGLSSSAPGLVVADRSALTAAFADQQQTSQWINYLLVATIVGYAVIALVNTLIMTTTRRRREFALQRLIGSTGRQIVRMMCVESVLVALSGIALGTAVAAAVLVPFGLAADGSPVPQGPWWVYLAVVAGALLLSFGATVLPTCAALRTPATVAAMSSD